MHGPQNVKFVQTQFSFQYIKREIMDKVGHRNFISKSKNSRCHKHNVCTNSTSSLSVRFNSCLQLSCQYVNMDDILVIASVLLSGCFQQASRECRYRLQFIYRYQTIIGVHCLVKVVYCVINSYSMKRLTPALLSVMIVNEYL